MLRSTLYFLRPTLCRLVAPRTDFFAPSRTDQTGGSRIFFLKLSPADAAPPYPTAGPTGRYDHPGSPRVNTPGVRAAALFRPSELQMSSHRKRVKNRRGVISAGSAAGCHGLRSEAQQPCVRPLSQRDLRCAPTRRPTAHCLGERALSAEAPSNWRSGAKADATV